MGKKKIVEILTNHHHILLSNSMIVNHTYLSQFISHTDLSSKNTLLV